MPSSMSSRSIQSWMPSLRPSKSIKSLVKSSLLSSSYYHYRYRHNLFLLILPSSHKIHNTHNNHNICIIRIILNISKSLVVSVACGPPLAWSSLNHPSIIMNRLSSYHQLFFLVSKSISSTNRGGVVERLPRHYQNSLKGKNRRLITSLKLYSEIFTSLNFYSEIGETASEILRKNLIKNGNTLWLSLLIIMSGDIETNPGPDSASHFGRISLTALNVRGLKKETKFKQLLNIFHRQSDLNLTTIITLQETHVEYNNLKYTWAGKHIFTPGNGSKGGLITLLSNNINVLDDVSFNNEAQVSVLQIIDNNKVETVILANIHSPCAHNNSKLEYFKTVCDQIDLFRLSHDEAKII